MASHPLAGVFAFEGYMERTLEYMPMSVRMRLELCRVKLTLGQWCGLPLTVRQTVLDLACDTPEGILRIRRYLESTVAAFELGPLAPQVSDPRRWSARSRLPAVLVHAVNALGLPSLDRAAWSGLADVQRYALLKLAGEGRDGKLRLALQEVGLHRASEPDVRLAIPEDAGAGRETQVFALLAHGLRAGPYREFSRAIDRDSGA
jgi:hypothetical protein